MAAMGSAEPGQSQEPGTSSGSPTWMQVLKHPGHLLLLLPSHYQGAESDTEHQEDMGQQAKPQYLCLFQSFLPKHYGKAEKFPGPAQWHSRLSLSLWHWHLIGTPAQLPTVALLIQLPDNVLGKAAEDD